MSRVLVTGASKGIGRAIVSELAARGHDVIATARDVTTLEDLPAAARLALDVTDAAAAASAIGEARDRFGRLDVIVNNAGYANVSPIETTTDEDFRAQFETNFWGVYHVSKAAIPVLREQGSGIIMQFSSMGGRVGGSPGIASYQAAKFAIDGFSRVLQAETAPFGVKVIVVEPSGFKTDWAGSSMIVRDVPEAYADTVGAINRRVRQNPEGPAGDPVRAAHQLAADDEAHADARADVHEGEVVDLPAVAERPLGQGGSVHVVLHHQRRAERLAQAGQRRAQLRQDRIHQRGVGGDFHIHPPGEPLLLTHRDDQRIDRGVRRRKVLLSDDRGRRRYRCRNSHHGDQ